MDLNEMRKRFQQKKAGIIEESIVEEHTKSSFVEDTQKITLETHSEELPQEVITLIQSKQLLQAVARLKELRGLSLYDAKRLVDDYVSEHPFVDVPQKNDPVTSNGMIIRIGNNSDISVLEPTYNYVPGSNNISYTCKRVQNDSQWTTGELKIVCWMSENPYSWEKGFNGENYIMIGEHILGHLEEGYGFNDTNSVFTIPNDLNVPNCYFIFTINELSKDDNWLIVDYKNSSLEQLGNTRNVGSTNSPIEELVKSIIVEKLGVDEWEVTLEASFTNDLGADSLDSVELIMEFEKEFGITIPDEVAEKIATVGDAVAYIEANK